jgi:glycosyltransferase involved in cell wall biosynthesis
MNKKIVYIINYVEKNTDTHFFHIYELLRALDKKINVFLIVENKSDKILSNQYNQKFHNPFLRFIELLFVIFFLYFKGYRKIYIHYSYFGAIVSSLLSYFINLETYYWNCGELKQFVRKCAFRDFILKKIPVFYTFKMIDYLVTGNHTMKDYYIKHFNISSEKIIIMPNWINVERFQNTQNNFYIAETENKKIILFVHRISKRKGSDELLFLLNHFRTCNKYHFWIIGDGPELNFIRNKNRNKNVTFFGKVPNRNIGNYFKRSDLFIMPSLEEGFPRVILEAMVMKRKIIAYDVGGVKELLPKEFIVKKGDRMSFARKIMENDFSDFEYSDIKKYDINNVIKIFMKNIVRGGSY